MKTKNKYIVFAVIVIGCISALAFILFSHTNAKSDVTACLLPVYNTADFTPVWLTDENKNTEFHTIPSFSFTDQSGAAFGTKELEGKIYAVDFFFTSCPGICPKLTTNFTKVQQAYEKDSKVMLLSFSVTPDRDSVSVLDNYAKSHGIDYAKWRLLTGSKKDIYALARKSFFADEDLGLQEDENTFLHTENVLLIDTKGRIRGLYKGTYPLEIEKLIKEIGILEKE